ncbi:MAG: HD-GYP domain-containing protein, partial [Lachnospiraceae bacterium]|nr:HD-GYP domain-containing protein [Lachnospiraceae bacterium]
TSYEAEEYGIGNRVRVCEELSDHTIAVGGENGLSFLADGKVLRTIPYGKELGFAKILCFLEAGEGHLFAGTDGNGIIEIEKGECWEKAELAARVKRGDGIDSGVILRLVPDITEGNAFIVTSNGISYLSGKEVRPLKNFPYYNNYDILLDQDGELFVYGSAGIYVVDREKLLAGGEMDYQLLNAKMGLMGALTANAWNVTDSGKDAYLSTDRGVFKVNLDAYRMDKRSYRLMVSRVELDDKFYPIERGTEFTVERDVKKISFVPEIVNYTLEDPMVAYYLEGLETKRKVVTQSELSDIVYTNLHSGEYVFHLAILSSRTGRVVEESTYRFRKEKSIYDNSWFIVYMVVVAVIFIGWFSWFITRTWLQKTIELQQGRLQLAMQQVQMGNETILAIAKTVDAKDERTSKHSQRVSEYSVMIAREYGFTEAEQENLRKAALLHDIGKIAIPDSILNKPARLTDEEYAVMKTHVTKGAEILKDFTLIDHVVEGSRYHHERYDGRGYPDGLSGEKIPLYGRIIAIADAFDAMTANRVYRKKQDFDYVLSELHNGRGTQFDPELLDIFLKLLDEKKIDINAIYQEKERGEDADE